VTRARKTKIKVEEKMDKIIKFFTYVMMMICDTRALAEAINEAGSAEELDELVAKKAF
jgi:hypothetical protein